MININIPNLDKLIGVYKQYPELSKQKLNSTIAKSATLVQRNALIAAPVAVSGNLRSSIGITYGDLSATVMPTAKYAIDVEEGTKPHHVSAEQIQPWADLKGVPVWVIQRAIARYGTHAQPFMESAAEASQSDVSKFFKQCIDDLLSEVSSNSQ